MLAVNRFPCKLGLGQMDYEIFTYRRDTRREDRVLWSSPMTCAYWVGAGCNLIGFVLHFVCG